MNFTGDNFNASRAAWSTPDGKQETGNRKRNLGANPRGHKWPRYLLQSLCEAEITTCASLEEASYMSAAIHGRVDYGFRARFPFPVSH